MSLSLNFTLSTEVDLFISAVAVMLCTIGSPETSVTYWSSKSSEPDQSGNLFGASSTTPFACPHPHHHSKPHNYFDITDFSTQNAHDIIIPLSHLQNADNFIVVKACLFTESNFYHDQTIQNLNGSSGSSATTASTGIVQALSYSGSYTSAGQVPTTTTPVVYIADSFQTPSASGSIMWYFPVNTDATKDSRSSLSLNITATIDI